MRNSVIAVVVLAGAVLAAGALDARQESLAGEWTFSVEHFGLKLGLEQQKSTITGTLDWPHGDPVTLTGVFADDALMMTGNSTGENFAIHVDAAGMRNADGTLAGTLRAHFDEFNDAHELVRTRNQEIPWTATRGLHNVVHFPR